MLVMMSFEFSGFGDVGGCVGVFWRASLVRPGRACWLGVMHEHDADFLGGEEMLLRTVRRVESVLRDWRWGFGFRVRGGGGV